MKKINILIADDHPAFREGLARLLKDEADMEVVAVTGDGEEALEMAMKLQPDVVILDVALPKLSGIESAQQIRTACPATAVLMLSAYTYRAYISGALRAGAMGYLPKNIPLSKLVNAIRMVSAGDAVFNLKAIGQILPRSLSGKPNGRQYTEELHPREIEVLKLVARGASNREIAGQLRLSERTVQTHLTNVFKRLQVSSRTEAVLQALKEGWLSPKDMMNDGER